jgi:hypothetical protein
MPPGPLGDNKGAQGSEINCVPSGHEYSDTPRATRQFFSLDAYAKDSKYNKDMIPDWPTDEATSTG